jgi:glycosyltransferase involved in cell wall biosynthesis
MDVRAPTFLAVVPAYNEAGSVARVVDALHAQAPQFDVIVVDDGSTDQTAARARGAGFVYARENDYDYVAQVDGDGQHEPSELERLVSTLRADPSLDMVCGSRFISDQASYEAPLSRRTGIRMFAFMLSKILRQPITDPTSGFRLYNRRAIGLFARDYPHDYPEVEAVLMLHANRLRMTEVAVRMRHRETGHSSITAMRSAYYMIKVSLSLLVGLLRRRAVVDSGAPAPVSATRSI